MLLFPDPRLPYIVVADASGSAADGVLMQDQGNGLQPLAFLSRQLKSIEQRYSAYERELVVVAYCLQSWRHYLEGCLGGVTAVTDHQLLTLEVATEFLNAVHVRSYFFNATRSIRPFLCFLGGWQTRMSIIRTAEIPKIGKIGAKIRASVY